MTDELKRKKLFHSSHLRRLFICRALPLLLSFTPAVPSQTSDNSQIFPLTAQPYQKDDSAVTAMKKGTIKSLQDFVKQNKEFFKWDTIVINKDNVRKRTCLARYTPYDNQLEAKYFVPDTTGANKKMIATILKFCDTWNNADNQEFNFIHELHHKDSHLDGNIKRLYSKRRINPLYYDMPEIPLKPQESLFVRVFTIGLRDMGCINQWNEIGAECASVALQYEKFKDKLNLTGIRDSTIFTRQNEFTRALTDGSIDPFDMSEEAQNKRYSLFANSMVPWWQKTKKISYRSVSEVDVKNMISIAKATKTMLATESVPADMLRRIGVCMTFPLDGQFVNLYNYLRPKYRTLTPAPSVMKIIEEAEKTMPMYEYNNKPVLLHVLQNKSAFSFQQDQSSVPYAPQKTSFALYNRLKGGKQL